MNIDKNEIKLEYGSIDITVDDGFGEYMSNVEFDLAFLWVSPDDYYTRVVKYETYDTLEEAYRVYGELVKEVDVIRGEVL